MLTLLAFLPSIIFVGVVTMPWVVTIYMFIKTRNE